jgi:quinol monooxygenase YgiN
LVLQITASLQTGETEVPGKTSDLIVIASATAAPGRESELEQALREAAVPTRAQPGCVQFSLLRLRGSPATIIGFERWASEDDHQRHLKSAYLQKLLGRMTGILAGAPSIVMYEVLDE